MGSGYNFPFLISSFVGRWIFSIPFAVIAIYVFNSGVAWLWISFVIGDFAETIVIYVFYKIGKWKVKRVI